MRAPPEAALLDAWDAASASGPTARALALLAAAGVPPEEAGCWSIGRRDGAILALRQAIFGDVMEGVADCPRCGARLEARLEASAIQTRQSACSDVDLRLDGYHLRARCPDSADLLALEGAAPGSDLVAMLLERCLLSAERAGQSVPVMVLPAHILVALDGALAQADPMGDTSLALTCPACGHAWSANLDAAAWTWREVEGWAVRLLGDVHVLARAYGWTESEVLALPPRRRARYREMIGE